MGRRYGVPRYSFWQLVLDICLIILTGGLWIFWIPIREWRYSRRIY